MIKIFILPVEEKFQKSSQPGQFPAHNRDYGMEQDFFIFLNKHPEFLTQDPGMANWHYLPVYWQRWHVSHQRCLEAGAQPLQKEVYRIMLDDKKTFTVCQYSDGPLIDLGETVQCLASRKTESGIDIPLICTAHPKPFFSPPKKYLASFRGEVRNHPLRAELIDYLENRPDCDVGFKKLANTKEFIRHILESYIALSPRGYGGDSFRFYEAMQLGVVPFFIGDLDTRPFKSLLPWDAMSFFTHTIPELLESLSQLQGESEKLLAMGQQARHYWYRALNYQKWCPYLLKELESFKK